MTLNHRCDVARRDPRRAIPLLARRNPRRARSFMRVLTTALALACLGLAGTPAAAADPAAFQSQEWWLTALQMQRVWQITEGAGVTVAVLDTGSDPHIGDLRGAVLPGYDVTGMGGNGQLDYGAPLNPHGTKMAAIIAGRGTDPGFRGMAPKASILPVQMAGSSLGSQPQDIVKAINLVAGLTRPPSVMNISSGVPGPCSPAQQQAILHAIDRGIIVVASAGNDFQAGNEPDNPADCVGVLAVGAYDQRIAPWIGSQQQPYVAVAAPGVQIPSPVRKDGAQVFSTGTSDAAAAVSGMLALLRARFPDMPARQLVARLLATTHHIGPGPNENADGTRNRNLVAGYGAALPYQALTAAVAADAANPIYDAAAALPRPTRSRPAPATAGRSRVSATPLGSDGVSRSGARAAGGSNALALVGAVVVGAVLLVAIVIVGVASRSRRRRPADLPDAGGYHYDPGPGGGQP